jgi:hypothetical protein
MLVVVVPVAEYNQTQFSAKGALRRRGSDTAPIQRGGEHYYVRGARC